MSAAPEQRFYSGEELLALSGLEAMQAVRDGRATPPTISTTLNFTLAEVEFGRAVFEGTPNASILNPLGFVHGGWALTLLDSCTGCAAHTTLPAGVGYTTVETKGNFVRAITPETGIVRAEGKVVAQGRTIITAEGRITDGKGRLLAHGTSTLIVLRPQGPEGK
ncbi:MAG: PaaI family thioesterase [Hyphomonadaceae bacterium]